jgi:hypothetical protein
MAVSCMKPSPWPLTAYRQHRAEVGPVAVLPHLHHAMVEARNGLHTLVAKSGAWPFWAKRCDSEPLARKATVPS